MQFLEWPLEVGFQTQKILKYGHSFNGTLKLEDYTGHAIHPFLPLLQSKQIWWDLLLLVVGHRFSQTSWDLKSPAFSGTGLKHLTYCRRLGLASWSDAWTTNSGSVWWGEIVALQLRPFLSLEVPLQGRAPALFKGSSSLLFESATSFFWSLPTASGHKYGRECWQVSFAFMLSSHRLVDHSQLWAASEHHLSWVTELNHSTLFELVVQF